MKASERMLVWAVAVLVLLLLTGRDAASRNGDEAVQLAQRLCEQTGYQPADGLDALAAAYAETGRFSEAIDTAHKAIELAIAAGRQELARQIQARFELYQAGHSVHEGSPYR